MAANRFRTLTTRREDMSLTIPASSHNGTPRKISSVAAEYLHPIWTPNGDAIVVSRGSGATTPGAWNGWNTTAGWAAVRIPLSDATVPVVVADLAGVESRRTYFGPQGRLHFQHQDGSSAARSLLYYPFPSDSALRLVLHVRSVAPNGGTVRNHVTLPASFGGGSEPVLSPGGMDSVSGRALRLRCSHAE